MLKITSQRKRMNWFQDLQRSLKSLV